MARAPPAKRMPPTQLYDEEEDEDLESWMDTGGTASHLPPMSRTIKAWRRIFLRAAQIWETTTENQVTDYLTKKTGQPTLSQEECNHPLFARVAGGNRYGRYVHCRVCRTRLSMTPTPSGPTAKAKAKPKSKAEPYDPPKPKSKAKNSSKPESSGAGGTSSRSTRRSQQTRSHKEPQHLTQAIAGPMSQMAQMLSQVGGAMQQIQVSQQRLSALADPHMETPVPTAPSQQETARPPATMVSAEPPQFGATFSSVNHH